MLQANSHDIVLLPVYYTVRNVFENYVVRLCNDADIECRDSMNATRLWKCIIRCEYNNLCEGNGVQGLNDACARQWCMIHDVRHHVLLHTGIEVLDWVFVSNTLFQVTIHFMYPIDLTPTGC